MKTLEVTVLLNWPLQGDASVLPKGHGIEPEDFGSVEEL